MHLNCLDSDIEELQHTDIETATEGLIYHIETSDTRITKSIIEMGDRATEAHKIMYTAERQITSYQSNIYHIHSLPSPNDHPTTYRKLDLKTYSSKSPNLKHCRTNTKKLSSLYALNTKPTSSSSGGRQNKTLFIPPHSKSSSQLSPVAFPPLKTKCPPWSI